MLKFLKHPAIIAAAMTQAVFAALWLNVWEGHFAWAELLAYDSMLAEQTTANPGDQAVVLIGASDADVEALNWPVTDQVLADLMEKVLQAEPKAVGVDLYRSEPRPPGSDKLDKLIRDNDRVFMAYKFAEHEKGIAAPAAAEETGQIGFTDLMLDPGGIVRRGLLFLNSSGGESGTGLALQLAMRALADDGVCMQSDGTDANNLMLGACPHEGDASAQSSAPTTEKHNVVIRPFEESDGGYVRADARGYQVLIDYRNGFHPFPILGFRDVLEGRVPPERLRGKVVIIGVAAEAVKDFFFTPFSRTADVAQTSFGMEIHGHIISELLRYGAGRAKPIGSMAEWQEILWLWLWCMLGALMGYKVRSPWDFAGRTVSGVVIIALLGFITLSSFLWLPVAAPITGWLACAAITTSFMSYMENKNRAALMGLFSRHVSPGIAEALWDQRADFMDGNRPRPQRLTATVLFTDIKGFSEVSEKLDAGELMDWLNTYMTTMSRVVSIHGGVIDKFIGDAIMVVFGIPRKRTTDAEIAGDAMAAVMCGVAMNQELALLNAASAAEGKPTIGMRIGIHTGQLVAGALGGTERLDYTVIGDTVNTAARLESFDKTVVDPDDPDAACRLIISETTRTHLGNRFPTLCIGEVDLKGKSQQVKIHIVKLGGHTVAAAPQKLAG